VWDHFPSLTSTPDRSDDNNVDIIYVFIAASLRMADKKAEVVITYCAADADFVNSFKGASRRNSARVLYVGIYIYRLAYLLCVKSTQ